MASQRLYELRDELAEVRSAISALLTSGQEYSLVGSHSWKGADIKGLRKRESILRAQIYQLSGGKSFTISDFSGGADKSTVLK